MIASFQKLYLTNFVSYFRYILGVESPLVCDILHTADENGLMQVTSKADFVAATTTTTKSPVTTEREYIKFTLEDAVTEKKEEEKVTKG